MPTPKKGETKKKFIKRCIPYLYNEEPETLTAKGKKKNKQSYAICNSIFDKHKKNVKEDMIISFDEFVNEEYDYGNNEFEVGDKVVIDLIDEMDPWEDEWWEYHDKTGTIIMDEYYDEEFEDTLCGVKIDDSDISLTRNIYIPTRLLTLVEEQQPDDRFEKWEESVNEEYNYDKKEFEVGDFVKLNNILKTEEQSWSNKNKILFDSVGEIVENLGFMYSTNSIMYRVKFPEISDQHYVFCDYWLDLVEKYPNDDRFEKWEERKINEEYNYDKKEFEVGDKVFVNDSFLKNARGVVIKKLSDDLYQVEFEFNLIGAGMGFARIQIGKDGYCRNVRKNNLELVEEIDDRFEKWEESVNEEYDYDNDEFEVGDKVVCIDNIGLESYLDIDKVYTVTRIHYEDGYKYLYLDGIMGVTPFPRRFELVEELDDRFEKWED